MIGLSRSASRSFNRFRKAFAAWRPFAVDVKEVEFRIPERQHALEDERPGHRPYLFDAFAPCRAGAGQDDLSDEAGFFQHYVLRHETAKGEAEQVDLLETERANERNRVFRHLLHRERRLAARCADAPVVDGDHWSGRGEAVNDARIEVV